MDLECTTNLTPHDQRDLLREQVTVSDAFGVSSITSCSTPCWNCSSVCRVFVTIEFRCCWRRWQACHIYKIVDVRCWRRSSQVLDTFLKADVIRSSVHLFVHIGEFKYVTQDALRRCEQEFSNSRRKFLCGTSQGLFQNLQELELELEGTYSLITCAHRHLRILSSPLPRTFLPR